MSKTENEKEKGGQKKDRVYFEISMIRQIPLNMPESTQLLLSPYRIIQSCKKKIFGFCFRCGCCRRCVIVVGHLFLPMVFFYSSCPLLF